MRDWTRLPLLLPAWRAVANAPPPCCGRMGIDAAEVQVSAADGPAERRRVAYPVGPEGARIEAAAPMVGNYHWLIAAARIRQ